MAWTRRKSLLALTAGLAGLGTEAFSRRTPTTLIYPDTDYAQQVGGRPGGVLRTNASYEPGSFDIHKLLAGNLVWQGRLIYDGLVYLDPHGRPTPWLARSWTVSPDGRTYVFRLRPAVTFSDGVRFDARAVLVNFERIKALGLQSHISSVYLAPYVEGRVLDPFTFEARLDAPYPAFLAFLAQTWMGFLSPRQIAEAPDSIATRPIGTGPFVVTDYQPGKCAVFRRREDYNWAPDQLRHAGPAYLEGVVLDAVADEAARAEQVLSGVHGLTFEAPAASAARFRADPTMVFSNRVRPGAPMRSLSFNTHRFPFDDVRIRRAAALAMDRRSITAALGCGEFLPKADYLGTNTTGYDSAYSGVLAYDPAAASALLDAAGWRERGADGIRVKAGQRLSAELATTGGERTPPTSVLSMQSDLRNAGLDLRLKPVTNAGLLDVLRTGDYDALTGGWWSATTADVLFVLYHSSQLARQYALGQNTANLSDPRLDDVLLRARHTLDPQARQGLYRQAQALLVDLVPVVSLHESHHLSAWRRDVRGVVFDTTHNTPILTTAWLAQA